MDIEKDKGGRPQYKPTDEDRKQVETFAAVGISQDQISQVLDIDPKTLRLHFRKELDASAIKANATIGQTLFQKAKGGDTAAMIWWTKARSGWRGEAVLEHKGEVAHKVTGVEVLANLLEEHDITRTKAED